MRAAIMSRVDYVDTKPGRSAAGPVGPGVENIYRQDQ